MNYDLSHLTQHPDQHVLGPIQDDEALMLFAMCRVMRIKNVVELGVYQAYSARNFLSAVGKSGHVIGIDIYDPGFRAENFTFIGGNAAEVSPESIPWQIDLVFFDCHDEDAQKKFYENMSIAGKINDKTVIAIHDTGLHPRWMNIGIEIKAGRMHQPAERRFSNWLVGLGWSPFHAHAGIDRLGSDLPFRHGFTVLCKERELET